MEKLPIKTVKELIIKASNDMGVNPCIMLAFASIETGGTFNNLASNGSYQGVFQLSNGYGGVKGNDRYDPYKSCIGAINGIKELENTFKNKGLKYYDYYAYLRHQQGLNGLLQIIEHKEEKIENFSRKKALYANLPKKVKAIYVKDFISYWENRFLQEMDKCEIKCSISGLSDANNCEIIYNGEKFQSNTDIKYLINYKSNRNYYL